MRPVEAVLITIIVILLPFIQLNHQQLVVFRLMYERWANECLTILAAAMIRRRNRRQFPVLDSRGLTFTTTMQQYQKSFFVSSYE